MTGKKLTHPDTMETSGASHAREASAKVITDPRPLRFRSAVAALARCVIKTFVLLVGHEISQPTDHLGQVLRFEDDSGGRVYRQTTRRRAAVDSPVLLVVGFRLRWVRGRGHAVFRAESLLNTPLFVGFPGFRSKLWLAHDANGVYRGVYQWNDARLADDYVRALWWVLALVSAPGSIQYAVIPGLRLGDVLKDPSLVEAGAPVPAGAWWRLIHVEDAATTEHASHPTPGR